MRKLSQALISLALQMAEEERFLGELQRRDERVGIATFLPVHAQAALVNGAIFVLFDRGRLVCRLPRDMAKELISPPGYELWPDPTTGELAPDHVRLPSHLDHAERLRYGLAALEHAAH